MHPEAYEAVGRMVTASGHDFADGDSGGIPEGWTGWYGLDIGGRDVNGTARAHFPHTHWRGLDIRPGPGVDIVEDATTWRGVKPGFEDFVLSTECLEHVENWRGIVECAASVLSPGGPMLAFFTAASTGRAPHGASGEHVPPPGEWYGNVRPDELSDALYENFIGVHVEYNPNPGDVYAWARGLKGRWL